MESIVKKIVTRDFDEMRETLEGWDHQYRQVRAGLFDGDLLLSQIGKLQISRNRWGRGLHYRGTAPPDTLGMAVTLNQRGEGRWLGMPTDTTTAIVQKRGAEAEFISPESWDAMVLTVPEQSFMQLARDLAGDAAEALPDMHGTVTFQPAAYVRIRRAGIAYFRVLEQAVENPVTSALLPPMARSLQSLVVGELVAAQAFGFEKPSLKRKRQIVRQAEDYIAGCEAFPVRMEDLCRALDVGERTLYYAFTDAVGTTPTHWLRIGRLNQVHRILMRADPAEALVKQVAIDNGFLHLGHFSHNYRLLFGETPSETLRH